MTLISDKNNNITIASPDIADIISSRKRYLHPEYIDEKSRFIYSQNRCPLSMLAETCKNIGKPIIENSIFQSQERLVSISPSCSSSCSAPKFSPHSTDFSPKEQSKIFDEGMKDKSVHEKQKKRKSQKREPETSNKRPPIDPHMLHSNYAISEFLKMNNISRDSFAKPPDSNNLGIPIYHHLMNQNINNPFNHPSIWKSKPPLPSARMPFPVNYLPPNYPLPPNIPIPNAMYRCPPPNILHDINQLYNHCSMDKSSICDCLPCVNRKSGLDKNLFNFLHGLHKERPPVNSNNILSFLQNVNSPSSASAIKYCMYCGQYIPSIQNLLNHIHTEHVDFVNTNLCPKLDPVANFSSNFSVDSLQSKEMNNNDLQALKSMELLKQLQLIYGNENQADNCIDKPVLMK